MANTLLTNRQKLTTADALRYDPLKEDALKYDQAGVGVESRKDVNPYYKDIGAALSPTGRAVYDATQQAYATDIQNRTVALGDYKTAATEQFAAADQQATGLLAQARDAAQAQQPELVPFTLHISGQSNSGSYTYNIDKRAADELVSRWQQGGVWTKINDNGSYEISGGPEHIAQLRDLEQQSKDAQTAYGQESTKALDDIQAQFAAERQTAQDQYNQTVDEQQAWIDEQTRRAQQITKDLQSNFQRGLANNTSGINNLINSGALTKTATVTRA